MEKLLMTYILELRRHKTRCLQQGRKRIHYQTDLQEKALHVLDFVEQHNGSLQEAATLMDIPSASLIRWLDDYTKPRQIQRTPLHVALQTNLVIQ